MLPCFPRTNLSPSQLQCISKDFLSSSASNIIEFGSASYIIIEKYEHICAQDRVCLVFRDRKIIFHLKNNIYFIISKILLSALSPN